MENQRPSREQLLLDPIYKSSLVLRSVDLSGNPKNAHDVDLESQEESKKGKGGEEVDEKGSIKAVSKMAKQKRVCSICCCYSLYIILIVLLALAIVVLKLVPKDPLVSLGDLHVTEFYYNSSSSTSPEIEASLDFNLSLTNRNLHATEIYEEISLGIFYKGESLGNMSLPSSNQKRKSTETFSAELPRTQTIIREQADVQSLTRDVASSNVQIEVRGTVKGKHKVLRVKVKSFNVVVFCKVNVKPRADGVEPEEILPYSCYY